ncbi:MAG TPA: hypothetical protein VND64_30195 [Pirellulales bacterium]|nr:hypothetical protein [Pirellulales bacterium]
MASTPAPENPVARSLKLDDIKGNEIYRGLIVYYLHQDKLSWNRLQSLAVVQAALIAGALSARGGLGIIALAAGVFVAIIAWSLIERDWEIRDQHLHLLDAVHQPLGIRMVQPSRILPNWWRGTVIIRALLVLIIIVNFSLIGYLSCAGNQ